MTRRLPLSWLCAVALLFTVAACTNPYDPAQRAVGGGLIGAGAGALIGGAAAGGYGAALGAATGGVAGALLGVATTPRPYYYGGYYYRHYRHHARHRRHRYARAHRRYRCGSSCP